MDKFLHKASQQWRDSANFVLGLWLFVSPWVLQHLDEPMAMWNAVALGIVIAISALAAVAKFHEWEEWVSVAFGAWLVIAPWVLGYAGSVAAMTNHVIIGVLVAGMALWTIWHVHHDKAQTA